MQSVYHKEYSHSLQRDMEYKVYGHAGKPVLVFPTSKGRFYQYEDSGMITALSGLIDNGHIQIWTVDGIDWETFFSPHWDMHQRIDRHEQYFKYIRDELMPHILQESVRNNAGRKQQLLLTGCSMGAFHAANFFFRFPWQIDGLICLSGVYSTKYFFGDYMDQEIYFNSPINYLEQLTDEAYLAKYRSSSLFFCCGQGSFEDVMLADTHQLQQILINKKVPAWVDIWGEDVAHDWDWWQKQARYFFQQWLSSERL